MKTNIDPLFKELSEMIPEIKQNPEQWKAFLQKFMENKPNAQIDTDFKQQLKDQIEHEIQRKKEVETPPFKMLWWKWFAGFAGAMAMLVLVINFTFPGTFHFPESENLSQTDEDFAAVQLTSSEKQEAFGDIEMTANAAMVDSNMSKEMAARGGGLGIYPEGKINFKYEYVGQPLPELNTQTMVYQNKKQSVVAVDKNLQTLLNDVDLDALDLSQLNALQVRQLTLVESVGELPYIVNVDLYNKSIGLYSDYEVWQKKFCPQQICDTTPLTKANLPTDEEIKAIATDFLSRLKVNLSQTSAPEIQKYWKMYPLIDGSTPEPETYPDTLQVIFPLTLEGASIHESWEQPMGISVEVNLRQKNVISANIPVLQLESSAYPVYSREEILELAQKGGYDGIQYNNPDRTIDLKIDTPKKELRRIWQNAVEGSKEIFVEMLVFPVLNQEGKESPYYVPKEIVVPLAKK